MPKKKSVQRRRLAPHEARDLDVEIGFLEGVVRRDPTYFDAWLLLGDDYACRGRYRDGLTVDLRLCDLQPENALAHYNLACSYSLTGQPERAVRTLARALELGYRDFRWMRRDPDLKNARRHPLFAAIRERVRALEVQVL